MPPPFLAIAGSLLRAMLKFPVTLSSLSPPCPPFDLKGYSHLDLYQWAYSFVSYSPIFYHHAVSTLSKFMSITYNTAPL